MYLHVLYVLRFLPIYKLYIHFKTLLYIELLEEALYYLDKLILLYKVYYNSIVYRNR